MVTIGNGTEYISLEVTRHFPVSDNQPWEAYFLRVSGKCSFLSFDLDPVGAHKTELEKWYHKLKACYDALSDECVVERFGYNENFSLRLRFEKTGRVAVTAVIADPTVENKCEIRFYTDQTFIAITLDQIKQTFGF